MKKYFMPGIFLVLFLFSSSLLLCSQAGRGRARLSGKVKVPQGHPVANVSQFNINASVNIVLKKRKQLVEKAPGLEMFEKGNQQLREEKYEQALQSYQNSLEMLSDTKRVILVKNILEYIKKIKYKKAP